MSDRVEVFGPWKLSTGRWRGYVRGPDGKRRERNAATRTACAERLDVARRDVEAGIEGNRTYDHWVDVAVAAAKPGGAPPSANTTEHRRYLASLVAAWLAAKPVRQVRPARRGGCPG